MIGNLCRVCMKNTHSRNSKYRMCRQCYIEFVEMRADVSQRRHTDARKDSCSCGNKKLKASRRCSQCWSKELGAIMKKKWENGEICTRARR